LLKTMCPCWSCPPAALDPRTKTISRTITGLVADGACLQMGVGALPNLVCESGKSIIATRSTAAGGKISRIVPRLEGPVTTPRIDTHYVVTEFGSATALLPMALTFLLGFVAAWHHDFGPKDASILNRIVLHYAVPRALFAGTVSTSRTQLSQEIPLVVTLCGSIIGLFVVIFLLFRVAFRLQMGTSALGALTASAPAVPFVGPGVLGDVFGGSSAIPIAQADQHGPSQAEGIAGFASRARYEDLTVERREPLKVSIMDGLASTINALGAQPIEAQG
jgi:Acetyl-CoA hydrolase/transferase C-terminal domain/Membrane transport protein